MSVLSEAVALGILGNEAGRDSICREFVRRTVIRQGESTVMFSGGLDSTTTVVLLSEVYERLHLLTFCNGYGHCFVRWSKKQRPNFDRILGVDRYVHVIQSCSDLFDRLLIDTLTKDYRTYKSKFIWCMACKLAMHTYTIMYCLEHEIRHSSDGSSTQTNYYVEQMEMSLKAIKDYYGEFGIDFSTPVYRVGSRDEEVRILAQKGIKKVGLSIAGRNPGTQPLCVPGNLIYFFSTFFKIHPKYAQDDVLRFIDEKKRIAESYMREKLGEKGLDVDELTQRLKGGDCTRWRAVD
ncbi:MAG TPA: hypothetical protein VM163_03815 [bacterium]|nr:hypothetical protein [bacterium]